MYEFLEQNSLYVVLIIVLMIWGGVFSYLVSLDRQIRKLQGK
jgi:CcmD family protein